MALVLRRMASVRLDQSEGGRPRARSLATGAMLLLLAGAMAGCSADFAGMDGPFSGFAEGDGHPVPRSGMRQDVGAPVPDASYDGPPSDRYASPPPSGYPATSALPSPYASSSPYAKPPRYAAATPPPGYAPAPQPRPPVPERPVARGETIDVVPGDTLYGISHRYHVSIADLQSLNGLTSATIKPGQKLVLPASARGVAAAPPAAATAPVAPVSTAAATPFPPVAPAPRPSASVAPAPAPIVHQDTAAAAPSASASAGGGLNPDGTYTVRPHDSLYQIARTTRVSMFEIMRINGIADQRKICAGQVLRLKGEPGSAAADSAAPAPMAEPAPAPSRAPASSSGPHLINSAGATISSAAPAGEPASPPTRVASAGTGSMTDAARAPAGPPDTSPASAPGSSSSPTFRWPVRGHQIAGFGPRADGQSNDGINFEVPRGTDVQAAEAGEVAYAGNQLKGYGNLVLIRHANGYVTAYAHNETLLVKQGDKVRRGQVIAKAGNTGLVDQPPQVHFELRQGSTPIDPTPYMEKI